MKNRSNKKQDFQGRQGFALIFSIFLVVIVSFLSYRIVENNIFSSNLNKLKYLHFQANIFMDSLKRYIETHSSSQILSYGLDDPRFKLEIIQKDEDAREVYYVMIESSDGSPIRLSEKIIK